MSNSYSTTSLLSTLQSAIQQISSVESSSSSSSTKKSGSNINIGELLSGTYSLGSNGSSTNTETILNKVQSIMTKVLSEINTNSDSEAKKSTKANDKRLKETSDNIEKTNQAVTTKLEEIMSQCETSSTTIQNALDRIEELGGDDGVIQEAQQKLDKKLEEINKQKEILNNPNSKPEERQAALSTMLNAISGINELVELVNEYQAEIDSLSTDVNNESENLTSLVTEKDETVQEGQESAIANATDLQSDLAETTDLAVTSLGKTALGEGQEAAADAASSNMFTSSAAIELRQSATDKLSAGATLMSGAIQGLKTIGSANSSNSAGVGYWINFANGLGTYAESAQTLVGSYNSQVQPMIESIGTWVDTVSTANQSLEAYYAEYSQSVSDQTSGNEQNSGDENQGLTNNKVKSTDNNEENQKVEFKKFEFDTSIFNVKSK
jgi:hypothetical protein